MKIKNYQNIEHTFNYCDLPIVLPSFATLQLLETLKGWQAAFLPEETFVSRNYGIPCLIVRFDGVLRDGRFESYEIQEGPEWVGYAAIANTQFRVMRDEFIRHKWPKFKLLMHERINKSSDDPLWIDKVTLQEALDSEDLLHVRYPFLWVDASLMPRILPRSVRSMSQRNDKNYGLKLGWWKKILWQDSSSVDALPWDEEFALKPLRALGSRDVMLWKPTERAGRATRTQIEETLKRRGEMILQPFFEPMQMDIAGKPYNVILRPFFGFNTLTRQWEPMGGVWTGRPYPNLRIHGSSDAISGPLYLE